jgi:hypothetical protein
MGVLERSAAKSLQSPDEQLQQVLDAWPHLSTDARKVIVGAVAQFIKIE